jgi:hypothetical protein
MTLDKNPKNMTNFFLCRSRSMFFVDLMFLQDKKKKIYDLRKEYAISDVYSKTILKSFKDFKLLDDCFYDKSINSYTVKYSEDGLKLRKKILELKSFFERLKM